MDWTILSSCHFHALETPFYRCTNFNLLHGIKFIGCRSNILSILLLLYEHVHSWCSLIVLYLGFNELIRYFKWGNWNIEQSNDANDANKDISNEQWIIIRRAGFYTRKCQYFYFNDTYLYRSIHTRNEGRRGHFHFNL